MNPSIRSIFQFIILISLFTSTTFVCGKIGFSRDHINLYWTFSQQNQYPCLSKFINLLSSNSLIENTKNLAISACKYCSNSLVDENIFQFEVTDFYHTDHDFLTHIYLRQVYLHKPIINSLVSAHYSMNSTLVAFSSSVSCSFPFLRHYSEFNPMLLLYEQYKFLKGPLSNDKFNIVKYFDEFFLKASIICFFERILSNTTLLTSQLYIEQGEISYESHIYFQDFNPVKALASWFYYENILLPVWKFEFIVGNYEDMIIGIVTPFLGYPKLLELTTRTKTFVPTTAFDKISSNMHINTTFHVSYGYPDQNDAEQNVYFSKDDNLRDNTISSYLAFPIGKDSPLDGLPTECFGPIVRRASPIGWNSINIHGHSTYSTIGNNVIAHENHAGTESWQYKNRPFSFNSSFVYPITNYSNPYSYVNTSIANAFYCINLLHDMLYIFGFTEAAGNFQQKNFNRGGLGNDAIIADVQDGSGDSNASFMTPADGQPGRMKLFLWSKSMRDSALESCIIIHEFMHGVSTRLTGGPSNADCLSFGEAGGMGEGWGDFFSILMRVNGSTSLNASFSIGEYASGDKNGVRSHPYSTDNAINYGTIRKNLSGIHGIGEVWAQILYDLYRSLRADHFSYFNGHNYLWDDDPIGRGANDVIIRVLIEGMKLQPCWPSFIDGRDAILAAEKLRFNEKYRCSFWRGFASRGLGLYARPGGWESYEVPSDCW